MASSYPRYSQARIIRIFWGGGFLPADPVKEAHVGGNGSAPKCLSNSVWMDSPVEPELSEGAGPISSESPGTGQWVGPSPAGISSIGSSVPYWTCMEPLWEPQGWSICISEGCSSHVKILSKWFCMVMIEHGTDSNGSVPVCTIRTACLVTDCILMVLSGSLEKVKRGLLSKAENAFLVVFLA